MKERLIVKYADLLPPLSTQEYEALKADIETNGIQHPVIVDEANVILDGHNRYSIDSSAPTIIMPGLSETEKKAFVYKANLARRNMSPAQKEEARRKMKVIAKALREEDPKKWTQQQVALALGVARTCVEEWFRKAMHNDNIVNTHNGPDARVKINPKKKPEIFKKAKSGKISQSQLAADYGVTQSAISRIVKQEEKADETKQRREKAAKSRESDCGIVHSDFKQFLASIPDNSIDLIFTDPPYNESSASLYKELADAAYQKMAPGAWLLLYSGHFHLPKIYSEIISGKLAYGWTFCIIHSGGHTRIRKYKLQSGWKPIIGLYKEPLAVSWDWSADTISGGKEKQDHEWQQAEGEATHFIKIFCPEHGLVCDPFCGSGTTLLAAKKLGRKWIGCDQDIDSVEKARTKVSQ